MQQKLSLNPNQEPYSGILSSCMKLCKAHWPAGCVLWQRVLLQHGEPNKGLFPSPSDGRWWLDPGGAVGKLSKSSYSHRRSQHSAHRRRKSAAVAAFHIFRCAANDRNGVPAGPVKGFFWTPKSGVPAGHEKSWIVSFHFAGSRKSWNWTWVL